MASTAHRPTWKKLALIGIICVIRYFVLAREPWVVEQMQQEQANARALIGAQRANVAIARATRWYQGAFIDSGVQAESFHLLVPTQAEREATGRPEAGAPMWKFVEDRIRVLWTVVYQALLRVSLAMTWLPLILLLGVGFVTDGIVTRKIKQSTFDYASPAWHRYSLLALDAGLVLFVLALFAPFAISPVIAPAFFIVAMAATGMLLANVQKRI